MENGPRYCPKCKTDVDAAKKDAAANGWTDKFEHAKVTPALFRKLILDYQKSCPSGGPGKKRPQYSKARAVEILSQETLSDEGSRFAKFDWFDYDRFYRAKGMKPADIDAKWKAQLAEAGAYDNGGDNPDYPGTRSGSFVKIKDYIDAKHRKRQATEVVCETGNDRRFLEQDAAQEHLNLSAPSSWDAEFFGEAGP